MSEQKLPEIADNPPSMFESMKMYLDYVQHGANMLIAEHPLVILVITVVAAFFGLYLILPELLAKFIILVPITAFTCISVRGMLSEETEFFAHLIDDVQKLMPSKPRAMPGMGLQHEEHGDDQLERALRESAAMAAAGDRKL